MTIAELEEQLFLCKAENLKLAWALRDTTVYLLEVTDPNQRSTINTEAVSDLVEKVQELLKGKIRRGEARPE